MKETPEKIIDDGKMTMRQTSYPKSYFQVTKVGIEVLGILGGLILAGIGILQFSAFIEHRRIENQIMIIDRFAATISLSKFSQGISSEGWPMVELIIRNETNFPATFERIGANYYDCEGKIVPNVTPNATETFGEQEFDVAPHSSSTIWVRTDPIKNNFVLTDYFSYSRPFIVGFQFSARLKHTEAFSSHIAKWQMATGIRRGPNDIIDDGAYTWLYEFRGVYKPSIILFDDAGDLVGLEVESYLTGDCEYPNHRDLEIWVQ